VRANVRLQILSSETVAGRDEDAVHRGNGGGASRHGVPRQSLGTRGDPGYLGRGQGALSGWGAATFEFLTPSPCAAVSLDWIGKPLVRC
jgi:hypothetical protein